MDATGPVTPRWPRTLALAAGLAVLLLVANAAALGALPRAPDGLVASAALDAVRIVGSAAAAGILGLLVAAVLPRRGLWERAGWTILLYLLVALVMAGAFYALAASAGLRTRDAVLHAATAALLWPAFVLEVLDCTALGLCGG